MPSRPVPKLKYRKCPRAGFDAKESWAQRSARAPIPPETKGRPRPQRMKGVRHIPSGKVPYSGGSRLISHVAQRKAERCRRSEAESAFVSSVLLGNLVILPGRV